MAKTREITVTDSDISRHGQSHVYWSGLAPLSLIFKPAEFIAKVIQIEIDNDSANIPQEITAKTCLFSIFPRKIFIGLIVPVHRNCNNSKFQSQGWLTDTKSGGETLGLDL